MNLYDKSYDNFGFVTEFLDVIVVISFLAAVFTIISKNPIVSVLNLILLFASLASFLICVGIVFIGISYLLVYVGAVSILFLFILMLINIRISELISGNSNYIPLAIISILVFFIPFSTLIPQNDVKVNDMFSFYSQNTEIVYASSNNWDGAIVDVYDISSIGNIMYTNYSIWLVQTSIILLLAMVGSIIVTINKKYNLM